MNTKPEERKHFSLRLFFSIIILLVFAGSSIAAAILSELLTRFFRLPIQLPASFYSVVISVILAGIMTTFLSKRIFEPTTRLGQAMSRVARGDFTATLESGSKLAEIQDLYKNFNLMVRELAATETLQSDFVSNVSHEFKTPINAIEGYATLLDGDDTLSQEQAEYAGKILFNTKRLSDLVGNILLLSKIDNQAILAKKESFRLDEQIRQAIVALESKWTEKDLEFDIELDEVNYTGSESLLFHVWQNLIDNAIKFDPPGGMLMLRLRASEQNLLVSVQDSGPGISEAGIKRVFDKFYQADSSHKDEGNGLGLALVKQIVSLHQGYITVENCPAGGCKFTVVLPTLL